MKKVKLKNIIIIIIIVVCLGISEVTWTLPYVVARITSSIYITINYPTKGLKYLNSEPDKTFGYYSITYKNKDGESTNLMMFPMMFPIIIINDSKKGQA